MSRMISWKWLCAQIAAERRRGVARSRPCLAQLEQLEDRVVLSSGFVPPAAPIPLSQQSLNAVNSFLTEQGRLLEEEGAFIQAQGDLLAQTGNKLPTAVVDYFLKIDTDLAQINADLVGTSGSTGATVGIDGILTYFKTSWPTKISLEATIIPTIKLQLQPGLQTVMTQLQKTTSSEITKVEGIKLEADVIELKTQSLAAAESFAQLEYELIGADAADLGPALGLQGSSSPGPVGGLLQDTVALAADASVGVPGSSSGTTAAVVDAFIKLESTFVADQNAFLQMEGAYLRKKLPGKMKSGQITVSREYFANLNADLLQIDSDLVGGAGVAAGSVGGIDGILLGLKQLSTSESTALHKLAAAVQQSVGTLNTDQAALQQISDDNTVNFDIAGLEATAQKLGNDLALGFAAMAHAFVQVDTTDLGPGPAGAGPAAGLLQDATVLMSDAGGQSPTDIVYPPPTVVDIFIKYQGAMVANENSFLAAEQEFIKLGVQLPSAIVDYFLQLDNAFIEVDTGLVGSTSGTVGGADGVLLQVGLPPAYHSNIQSNLAPAALAAEQAAMQAVAALQQNAGTAGPASAATLLIYSKLPLLQLQEQTALGNLSLSFGQIENEFIGLNPTNQSFIEDSKNIADGAAKGQASE